MRKRGLFIVILVSAVFADTWIWSEPRNYVPQPRFEHTASRVGSKLVVFGGTLSNDVRERDVHILDTDTKTWKTPTVTGKRPGPTAGHAAIVSHGSVYVLFGTNGASMTNAVFSYNVDGSRWTRVLSHGRVPSARAYHSAVEVDGVVYTFGGFDGRFYLNDLHKWQIYDPVTNETGLWVKQEQSGSVPDVRAAASVAVYGHQLFLFGGFEVAIYKNDFFQLDLDTLRWSRVALNAERSCALPSPRALASLTLVGDRLVLFGGIYCQSNGTCTPVHEVHQYDIHKAELSSSPPHGLIPPARYGHSATLFGSKILVFGGAAWPNHFSDLFQYDVYDNAWMGMAGTPPYARKQHTIHSFLDARDNTTKLVIFGGKHGAAGYSNHLHFFDTNSSRWTHGATDGPLPPPVGNHASVVKDGDALLVFGGYNGSLSNNDVYAVDLPDGQWQKLDVDGDVPRPCHGHSIVTLPSGNDFLQFGGVDCTHDNCTFFNELHALSFETLSWTRVTANGTVPRPRASHTMTAVAGTYLMFGGVGPYFNNFNDLFAYKVNAKEWLYIDAFGTRPSGRFGHTAQAHKGNLVVFGGATCHGIGDCVFLSDLYVFLTASRVWITLSVQGSYPSPRAGAAAVMLGDILYIHGGGAKDRIFGELVTVEPDKTVPKKTILFGKGATSGVAGTPTVLYAQLQDSFGTNRTSGGDNVTVRVAPTSHLAVARLAERPIALTVRDSDNGIYVAEFTTPVTGLYDVSVTVNGELVQTAHVTIEADKPNATLSSAKGPGLTRCVAGEECYFEVMLLDSYNNLLDKKVSLDANIAGPRRVIKRFKDSGSGKVRVSYTAEKTGSYSITALVGGHAIAGCPFNATVTAAAASPKRSRLTGPGLTGTSAGLVAKAMLTLFDQFDNPVTTGTDVVKGQLLGPDQLACSVENHGNGTYTIAYTAVKIGTYRLNVALGDDLVEGSPFEVRIANAPVAPATTFAYGKGLRYAIAGYRSFFTIQSADDFGNNMTRGGAQFNVLFAGPGDSKQICNVTDNGDGKYTVSYLTETAGDFMISATLWNSELGYQSIHLSPFLGYTVAAGADPRQSYVFVEDRNKPLASETTFRAVTGVHTFFQIQAVDRYGNKKTMGGDHFSAELEGPTTTTCFINDRGDGTYTGTYVAPASGKYWLKIFFGDTALNNTPIAVVVRSNYDECPNRCNGHGQCKESTCVCELGFSGLDCSVVTGNCLRNCMGNGACLNNTCYCYPGYAGAACDQAASLCPNACSHHGECVDAACVCDVGYKGDDCSNNLATCPGSCSGNGECVDGVCLCYPGFSGADCGTKAKFCPKGCSGRGRCMQTGMCSCHDGWSGLDCADRLLAHPLDATAALSQHASAPNALLPTDLPSKLPRKKAVVPGPRE